MMESKLKDTETMPDAAGLGEMSLGFALLCVLAGFGGWHWFGPAVGIAAAGTVAGLTFVLMGLRRRAEWTALMVATIGARALDGTLDTEFEES